MVEIVINYDQSTQNFKVYEPTTDTILVSTNLAEALVNLSKFLSESGLIEGDILSYTSISYHIDSFTLQAMVESNVNLLKRLSTAPSGFMISSQRFGTSLNQSSISKKESGFKDSGSKKFGHKSSGFSGKNGFKSASKKFGNNY